MATEEEISFALSDKKASEIGLFCSVATENGSSLSLREIIQLTSLDVSESQLERAWHNHFTLSNQYEISSGFVQEKRDESTGTDTLDPREERERRAESNISYAHNFAKSLGRSSKISVISISGSTSYRSVSRDDDLDFFCIAKKDSMWIFLTRALIKARLFRMKDKQAPWLCLSYVMDESYAESEFTTPQDALFARDAISTIVLLGEQYYDSLLARCDWMMRYFPKMYNLRAARRASKIESGSLAKKTAFLNRGLNTFLYISVGNYIRVKSHFLNRKFSRKGLTSRLFTLRIGRDHCIYESKNYFDLRMKYRGLDADENGQMEELE